MSHEHQRNPERDEVERPEPYLFIKEHCDCGAYRLVYIKDEVREPGGWMDPSREVIYINPDLPEN